MDGDGTTDLVVSSGSWDSDDGGTIPPPHLQLLKGTEDGLVAGRFITSPDTVSADSIAIGDIGDIDDGQQDVVFGRSTAAGGGLVGVVRGTVDGLAPRSILIGQNTPGAPEKGEADQNRPCMIARVGAAGELLAQVAGGETPLRLLTSLESWTFGGYRDAYRHPWRATLLESRALTASSLPRS